MYKIQKELKAPKGQFNSFGKYNYRSCEDIVEAVKPLLAKRDMWLIINDDLVNIGERYYVKATATIYSKEGKIAEATAFAREAEVKKGMDESQITGSTSSYARKYALNGLFAIDDTKDADSDENATQATTEPQIKCVQCGKDGMKVKDTKGKEMIVCPDWDKHKAVGEAFNCK